MKKSHSKISVAFLYDDSLDGSEGVAQYVKAVGAWLSSRGHYVTYLVGETQANQWHGGRIVSLARNIRVVFNGNRLSMPLYSKKRLIKQALDETRFDVIHVQVPYSPLMAARVIKRASKKTAVVGTFHIYPSGFLSRFGSRLLWAYLARNFKKIDKMFAVSSAAQDFAASAYRQQTSILPNVVEVTRFKTMVKPKPNTIVFLGRLVPRKGCLELIKAFAQLKKEIPEAKLIIGGKGPQRDDLERYVAKNDIADVEFVGFVAEEDKPAFLAQASVACYPSLNGESFGIVLIEAMAAGAGVVLGGNNPGYASVLGERPESLLDPKNTAEFAKRLARFLKDSKAASELHAWQQEAVKQYDVNVVGKKLIHEYRALIDIKNKIEHN